jgi:hypothetical protein
MKKYIVISFLTTLFSISKDAKCQSSLYNQLANFPLANYLNKPIDSLIVHLPAGFDTAFQISSNGTLTKGASLQINYPPNYQFWIEIYITDAQHININYPFVAIYRPDLAWPLALLRKEKIGSVSIYTGGYQIINEASIY